MDMFDIKNIRYSQCWEDADVLIPALSVQSGDHCLSISSAGDNTLSLLCSDPACIYAVDMHLSQLAVLELRMAAFKRLDYQQVLCLVGCNNNYNRLQLYRKCSDYLSLNSRNFWDRNSEYISMGIGNVGKFERYFSFFRRYILPLIHNKKHISELTQGRSYEDRRGFYYKTWDNWRWRLLFYLFFSKIIMSRYGRDESHFRYVKGGIASKLLRRTEHALIDLVPEENPYLEWIVYGVYKNTLPHYLREENFDVIRERVNRIKIFNERFEEFLRRDEARITSKYNLSDIFEYVSLDRYKSILKNLTEISPSKSRMVYWNMLVDRTRPIELADKIISLDRESQYFFEKDKAFFYSRFVVEEINY